MRGADRSVSRRAKPGGVREGWAPIRAVAPTTSALDLLPLPLSARTAAAERERKAEAPSDAPTSHTRRHDCVSPQQPLLTSSHLSHRQRRRCAARTPRTGSDETPLSLPHLDHHASPTPRSPRRLLCPIIREPHPPATTRPENHISPPTPRAAAHPRTPPPRTIPPHSRPALHRRRQRALQRCPTWRRRQHYPPQRRRRAGPASRRYRGGRR